MPSAKPAKHSMPTKSRWSDLIISGTSNWYLRILFLRLGWSLWSPRAWSPV